MATIKSAAPREGGAEDDVELLRRDGSSNNTTETSGANRELPACLDRRKPKPSWRDVLKVHPAAELFPMMSEAELRELGEDIKAHGLALPLIFREEDGGHWYLLDGRNRLAALEAVGAIIEAGVGVGPWISARIDGRDCFDSWRDIRSVDTDPWVYVVSANIARRHLTAEQKRDIIAKLLTATPQKSNRAIAATVKVDHKTVAAVRTEKEGTGEIPQLKAHTGKDGKVRTTKPKRPSAAALVGRKVEALTIADGFNEQERAKRDARIVADKHVKPATQSAEPTKTQRDYEKLRFLWKANHAFRSLWGSTNEKTRHRFIQWLDGGATDDDDGDEVA